MILLLFTYRGLNDVSRAPRPPKGLTTLVAMLLDRLAVYFISPFFLLIDLSKLSMLQSATTSVNCVALTAVACGEVVVQVSEVPLLVQVYQGPPLDS